MLLCHYAAIEIERHYRAAMLIEPPDISYAASLSPADALIIAADTLRRHAITLMKRRHYGRHDAAISFLPRCRRDTMPADAITLCFRFMLAARGLPLPFFAFIFFAPRRAFAATIRVAAVRHVSRHIIFIDTVTLR